MGNKNDLAYLGINELDAVGTLAATDEIIAIDPTSKIPMNGGTVQDILDLANAGEANTYSSQVAVSLAELKAGKTLIAAVTGKQIVVTNFVAVMNGSFEALTTADLEDSSGNVVVAKLAQAQMTDNAVLTPGITGAALGVGMGEGLTVSEALVIVNTGTDATTATGMTIALTYFLV